MLSDILKDPSVSTLITLVVGAALTWAFTALTLRVSDMKAHMTAQLQQQLFRQRRRRMCL